MAEIGYVALSTTDYARLIDLRTRMQILIDETEKMNANSGYYVYDARLIQMVTGVNREKEEK
jgi:hypothetical protein